jgi:hypothetical protein
MARDNAFRAVARISFDGIVHGAGECQRADHSSKHHDRVLLSARCAAALQLACEPVQLRAHVRCKHTANHLTLGERLCPCLCPVSERGA